MNSITIIILIVAIWYISGLMAVIGQNYICWRTYYCRLRPFTIEHALRDIFFINFGLIGLAIIIITLLIEKLQDSGTLDKIKNITLVKQRNSEK